MYFSVVLKFKIRKIHDGFLCLLYYVHTVTFLVWVAYFVLENLNLPNLIDTKVWKRLNLKVRSRREERRSEEEKLTCK